MLTLYCPDASAVRSGVMAAGHLLHPRMGLVGMLPEINRAMAAPGWDNILALPPEAAAAALVETTGAWVLGVECTPYACPIRCCSKGSVAPFPPQTRPPTHAR